LLNIIKAETRCTIHIKTQQGTKAFRKVSSHFEYIENRSCGLDVPWHPVREDHTAHA